MNATRKLLISTSKWKVVDKATGYMYEGTPKEIVLDMARQDYIVSAKTDYMLEVQDRVWELYNVRLIIVPGNFVYFLNQLAELSLIEITKED